MTPVAGATCATHPELAAARTCARCGRFCCDGCLSGPERAYCTECASRFSDPWGLHRSFEPVHALVTGVKLALSEWPRVLAVAALFSVSGAGLQVLLAPDGNDLRAMSLASRVSNLHDALIGIIGAQAILALLIARGEGRALSVGAALREGLGIWGHTLAARIRAGLFILGFMLLLIIPGLWKAVMLAFVTTAALRSRGDDPLEVSESLVRGRFWLVFGFLLLAAGALYVPMFLVLFAVGFVTEVLSAPRLVHEYLSELISRFFIDGLMTGVMYVAYTTLHHLIGRDMGSMLWREPPPPAGESRA